MRQVLGEVAKEVLTLACATNDGFSGGSGIRAPAVTGMMDMTSELACSIPGAPKDISAGWTDEPVSWAIINRSKEMLRFSPVSGKSA